MTFHAWLVLLPALFLLSAMPGPNNLLAAANGLHFGIGTAVAAVAGRIAAFVVMILLTVAGLGALLAASETAFAVVKWCGVAYLAWLGVRTWRGPPLLGPTGQGRADAPGSRLARQELLLAAGNPKAILIFTAAFPQFIDQALPALPQFAVIGVTFLVIEWVVATLYALAGRQLDALRPTRWARLPNKLFGSLFMAAAGLLTAARRA